MLFLFFFEIFAAMIDVFTKGYIIGICTSVPVGPIAILCIQRTLNKGRLQGFFFGLGAATSDCNYATIALFGLSFVLDFIKQNQLAIQIIGSLIILFFGIYIFFNNPVKVLNKNEPVKAISLSQDYFSSFFLTLSNPLIIFLFLGLFARFNFLTQETSIWESLVGVASVFAGAITWWFLITLVVSIFRKKFNIRGLWIVNKTTGSLIALLAICGFILSLLGKSVVV